MNEIILLCGAPGVGKSSAALALRELHHAEVVEVDDLRHELWHVPAVAELSDGQRHELAIAHAATVARALLRAGARCVVVVDTFSPEGIDVFIRALRDRAKFVTISLTVAVDDLAQRLATRPEVPGVFRDFAVARGMNERALLGPLSSQIHTTGAPPHEVASRIIARAATLSAG